YTTYSKMEYNLKIEPKVLAEYAQVKLLIIDDVGVSKRSEYAPDSLLTILDEREGTNLPTIVVSNLSLAEISQLIDDRIASRLSAFQVVTWEDLQPENKTGKPIDYRATKIPEKCELD
ncbi:MAG: ATP-binding protein, partial [Dokdonella sp.]